jgi:energy-coupling factor transport system ATP-binding protein
MIEVRNLSFGYSRNLVLRNISFSVKDGESILLLGVSGSGKTTLLKCLMGIIPNTIEGRFFGNVTIDGNDTKNFKKILRDIGIVLQDPETQIVTTKVSSEIAFGLENLCYDEKRISKIVRKFAKKFGILKKLNHDIKSLSYGEKKKVIIASMAAMDKKVFLFDEPLSNLDVEMKKEIFKLLKKLKEEGKTIIVAEQNPCILKPLFDRCLVLDKGKLIYDGNVREGLELLKKITQHPRVNKTKPMNDVVIEIENLFFDYGEKNVLRGINLRVKKNEVIVITGENGCGKTTLALCLCNLLKRKKGRIRLFGKDIDEYSSREIAEKIGFVFQNPNFQIFKSSVIDEINYGPKNFEKILRRKEMKELLNIFDLYEKRNFHPFSLSLGERKRLTIASILSIDPEIMILDEPAFGQDPYHFSKILRSMIGKKTILIMTHEESLFKIANRVFRMKNGKLEEIKCGRAM